jgi:hypothetical protein
MADLGTVEEVAGNVPDDTENPPQAPKRRYIFNDLTARPKSCPSEGLPEAEFSSSM